MLFKLKKNKTTFYRIGTLLFGPSSELANRNASGQLIHDAEDGVLLSNAIQNSGYYSIEYSGNAKNLSNTCLAVGVWMAGAPSAIGE